MKKIITFLLFAAFSFSSFSQVTLLKDFNGSSSGNPAKNTTNTKNTIVFNNKLYFSVDDANGNPILHSSDGTNAGTAPVTLTSTGQEIQLLNNELPHRIRQKPASTDTQLGILAHIKGDVSSYGLYTIDATGVHFISLPLPITSGGVYNYFLEINNIFYYLMKEGATSTLLKYDSGTTSQVATTTNLGNLVNSTYEYNGKIYLSTELPSSSIGGELYVFDPSDSSVSLVADIYNGPSSSGPSDFIVANGKLYFLATGISGRRMYVYDGTTTKEIVSLNDLFLSSNIEILTTGGVTYLIYSDSSGTKINSINTSTDIAFQLMTGITNADEFKTYNGYVYYSATVNPTIGNELYRTAGTVASTALVADIHPTGGSIPKYFVEYNNELYFRANNGGTNNGQELWKVDVNNNASLVEDFKTGGTHFNPFPFAAYNGNLYLSGMLNSSERELYTYQERITFTGNTSTDWNTASNWDKGAVPTATDNVVIPTGKSVTIGSIGFAQISCLNLTFVGTGNLTISPGSGLTIEANLTSSSDNRIVVTSSYDPVNSANNKSGSLILKGNTTNHKIKYKRKIYASAATPNYNWSLISSPVNSAVLNDVITSGNVATKGFNRAFAEYLTTQNQWQYVATTVDATTYNLLNGKGYSFASSETSPTQDVDFEGTINTTDQTINVFKFGSGAWNLIGNPFPSFIAINNPANATNNLLLDNNATLDANYKALYFWDATANSGDGAYIAINNASGSKYLAPGQGFFVHSSPTGGAFNFKENMQSHQLFSSFYKGSTTPEINLMVSDGSKVKSTQIKYLPNTTKSLDPGYDAGLFKGDNTSFNVYTHLANNSQGVDFMLQCVDQDYENTIIPVGIKAIANTEVTFSLNSNSLPTGIKVFLEDRQTNTITRLDQAGNEYKITIASNTNGVGRFYLHTSTQTVLNINEVALPEVNIYTNNRNLIITNTQGKTNIKMFDILGKKVFVTNKQSNGNLKLTIENSIKSGIYIVKVITNKGKSKTKKIVIK